MTVSRGIIAAFAVLTTSGMLSACSWQRTPERDTLVIADSWEPRSLDPLMLQGTQAALVNNLLFSYLLDVDNAGNLVAQAARDLPTTANGGISPDGRTIRYRLRRGLRWSDGTPLTARDAAFTFRAVMDPRNAAASRYGYDVVSSVTALNDTTLIVRMKRAFSPILSTFLGPGGNYGILPAHLLAKLPSLDHADYASHPIGSGPYALARWDRGDRMTLYANPLSNGKRAGIDHVVWRFVPSPQTMVSQLRTGEADAVFGAPPVMLPELRSLRAHRVVVTPVLGLAELQFNTTDAVVGDVRVRRALAMAIDWPRIIARGTAGAYSTSDAMRGVFGWAYDPTARYPRYDRPGAAALLDAAGWHVGADGMRHRGAATLDVTVAIPADEDALARVLTQAQADAAAVGIRIVPHVLGKALFKSLEGPINAGRYQASIDRIQTAPDPDPGWLIGCDQRAPRGFNRSRYCNAEVDAALNDAVATYDRSRRLHDYAIVQQRLARDVPFFPIFQDREIDVVPDRLRGFVPSTQNLPLQGIGKWSLR